jgi:mRNA-degrading endonuclease toxin of MazEF toxin-antitoxin module
MRRGEIWWSSPRLTGPRRKRRPLLVVSDDAFNLHEPYPKVMVVHLTSVRRPGGPYEWEVEIPRGNAGLDRTSVAKCAEVYTLWKDQLDRLVGTLRVSR